jgi:hypothetical protein
MCEALKLADIPHSYSLAATENTLSLALGSRLISESQRLGRRPILHLSMHGNSSGVALTNGFFLRWSDLYHRLEPLLLEMDNSLLIGMSSCEGLGAIRMAMQSEEIPVPFAVVGSGQNIEWSDAAVGFTTFYHRLFRGTELSACVDAMRTASGHESFVMLQGRTARGQWIEQELSRWIRMHGSVNFAPKPGGHGRGLLDGLLNPGTAQPEPLQGA